MAVKKEYRNAIRSRRMIRAAFVDLLHEKPFEKITATDIINRADINRSTFYAHYPDVNGIIDEITGEIMSRFQQTLAELDFSTFFENPQPILQEMLDFLLQNQEMYRLMGQSSTALEYLEGLKRIMIQQVLTTPSIPAKLRDPIGAQIRVRLLINGVVDVFRQWLAGDLVCTLGEIMDEMSRLIGEWTQLDI